MKIFDTHIHTIFRPTHFFEIYRLMNVETVISVAFYPVVPKYSETLEDLFRWIIERETQRLQFVNIACYCGIGIHPRSIPQNLNANIYKTIEESIHLPEVVCLGEIGLETGTKEEIEVFERQLIIAEQNSNFPVILHTPGKNKREITKKMVEILESVNIRFGIIDHISPENIDLAIDSGLYMGLTIQLGKLTIDNFLQIVREYEYYANRFLINSDLGIDIAQKDTVPKAVTQMFKEGIDRGIIESIAYKNAIKLFKL
ncbi:MAG TPA: TatD family hydrolase [Candidatus Deferrimicrobium sp.]|nr:TatD family hydrolase [Candidatus Deferrimicrobium sp.]